MLNAVLKKKFTLAGTCIVRVWKKSFSPHFEVNLEINILLSNKSNNFQRIP